MSSSAVLVQVLALVLVLAVWSPTAVDAYVYLPGVLEAKYNTSASVGIKVNSLRSAMDLTPYEFYTLPFCQPQTLIENQETLGQLLMGDDIESSPYKLRVLKNSKCERLTNCWRDTGSTAQVKQNIAKLRQFIEDDYRGHMSIDNLPGWNPRWWVYDARCTNAQLPLNRQGRGRRGFFIGVPKMCTGKTLLNNHLHFEIKYNQPVDGIAEYSVVGFNIKPMSIKWGDDISSCDADAFDELKPREPLALDDIEAGTATVAWTYSVKWLQFQNVTWATRWDAYLDSSFADSDSGSHIKYIINSMLITLCLTFIGYLILARMLHKDIARYNANQDSDEHQEDVGWKLVHADVFRPPVRCGLICALVGSGVQLVLMCAVALFFALLGFLSPANRGGLLTTLILLFVLAAFVAGYSCGRFLKMFDHREWKHVFLCSLLFPGLIFGTWFISNTMYWIVDSSSAVPFTKFLSIVALWLVITTTLTVLGASFAFHQEAITFPTRVGKLAREIPQVQHWWLRPPFVVLVPGFLPFGAAFLEFKFILMNIWQGQVYYMFGFLTITFIVWLVTAILVTLITQYYQLTYEDYRWWWRSFSIPSSCGLPIMAYAFYLYFNVLSIKSWIGMWVFWSYMSLFAVAYVLAAGAVGFVVGLFFVTRIYAVIKLD